jgi:hypothetical protein
MLRTLAIAASALIGALGAALVFQQTAESADQPKAQLVIEQNVDPGGSIRVHEQGTAAVNVANAANAPVLVRDVERQSSQPFQRELNLFSADDSSDCESFPVPLGKTLVIEHIAVTLELSGNNEVTTANGMDVEEAEAALTKLLTLRTNVSGELAEYPLLTAIRGRQIAIDNDGQRLNNRLLRASSEPVTIYATFGAVRACLDHGLTTALGVEQPDAAASVIVSGRSLGEGLILPPPPAVTRGEQ